MIRAGDADIVVAGGMENMTRAPYLLPAARFGFRMGDAQVVDSMVHDGLWDAFNDIHMGVTAENLADQYGIGREEQDEFAANSQQKAERAIADGVFKDEIVPIEVPVKGGTRLVDNDEHPRAGTTADALAKLRAGVPPRRRHGHGGQRLRRQRRGGGDRGDVARQAQERDLRTFGDSRELCLGRRRTEDHGHRPGACRAQGADECGARAGRHRPVRAQRGLRGAVARRASRARH